MNGTHRASGVTMLGPILEEYRVLVTAQRRADDLAAAFIRRGARVDIASTLGVEPRVDEAELLERTRQLLFAPPDVVVVTTAIGLRGWLETAEAAGLGVALADLLAGCGDRPGAEGARGPAEHRGYARLGGRVGDFSGDPRRLLSAEGVAGQRVAVQLHGAGDDGLASGLARAGAAVVSLTVYRWRASPDAAWWTRGGTHPHRWLRRGHLYLGTGSCGLDRGCPPPRRDGRHRPAHRGRAAAGGRRSGHRRAAGGGRVADQYPDRGRMGALVRR